MMRAGFSHEEIYDVLTGVGLPGEQLQLLIDRVSADFNSAELEPRTSRLAVEVEKIIQKYSTDIQHETSFRMEAVTRQLEMIKLEIEKLSYLITAGRKLKKQNK